MNDNLSPRFQIQKTKFHAEPEEEEKEAMHQIYHDDHANRDLEVNNHHENSNQITSHTQSYDVLIIPPRVIDQPLKMNHRGVDLDGVPKEIRKAMKLNNFLVSKLKKADKSKSKDLRKIPNNVLFEGGDDHDSELPAKPVDNNLFT